MKRRLCVVVFGLTLLQTHAWLQSNRALAAQAATPAASPTSTPSRGTALSSPARATSQASSIDSALQTQIQHALDKDPIFSQGHLKVTVLAEGIELAGDVASGRDRQNAARMAQSYARGKKVVNHIVVRGHNPQPGSNSPENPPANFSIPARNPESGKNNPP